MDLDAIALSFHDSLLRKSDVNLLRGPHWLNDQIISFYLEYLENVKFAAYKQQLLFVAPEVTQCIKLVAKQEVAVFFEPLKVHEKQFIFFPINDHQEDSVGGTHWSLLVYARSDRTFYHFDSAHNMNQEVCTYFVAHIKDALNCANDFTLKRADCLQQQNSYDCGIFVLCNVLNVAQHVSEVGTVNGLPRLSEHCVRCKRTEILQLIEQLSGES